MKKITNKDLFELLKVNGSLTVKVSNSKLFEESYAENGMVGVITSGKIDGVDNNETRYEFTIDWNKYSENNIPLESHDFFIPKTNNELGTMKEAGYYEDVERFYATDTVNSGFEILNENSSELKIFKLWKNSGTNMSYPKWTEEMISRLIKNLSTEKVNELIKIIKDQ